MYTSNNTRTNKQVYIKNGIGKVDRKMARDQSIPVFFIKLGKNDTLYMKTDIHFYGHLEPSYLTFWYGGFTFN